MTVKDDVRRLLQHTNSSPGAYREFESAAASQTSPWALLQAVQQAVGTPAATLHTPDTAPRPVPAYPEAGAAPAAASAPGSLHASWAANDQSVPVAPSPFGRIFRNASPTGTDARQEQPEDSLKSLLQGIGTCR